MARLVEVVVVRGAEGASLQVWGKNGGRRIAGPKAWGNPYNQPAHSFTVDADELIETVKQNAWDALPEPPKDEGVVSTPPSPW